MKLLVFLLLAISASGQTLNAPANVVNLGNVDISGAVTSKSMKSGNTLPPTCAVNELFFKSNATAGQNIYGCTTANIWTLQSGGSVSSVTSPTNTLTCSTVGASVTCDTNYALVAGTAQNNDLPGDNNVNINYESISLPNSGTATVTNRTVILTGTPSTGTVALTTTTKDVQGICASGCGSSGTARVPRWGKVSCEFDAATVAGDYVIPSTITGGKCHSAGTTVPTVQNLGYVLSTNVGSGTYTMLLEIGGTGGGGGGGGGDASTNTSTSVDGDPTVFSGTTGKILRRASPAFTILTDGPTITWAVPEVTANAQVTLGGNRTLAVSGLVNGGNYRLKVVQDATGSRSLALGGGCTWLVSGSGAGVITPTTAANAVDSLTWTYDGTNCLANFTKAFTGAAVAPVIALLTHTAAGSTTSNNVTTTGIDTSGANLVVIAVTGYGGTAIAPTDSKSNTWTGLTLQVTTGTARSRLFYCSPCTVGSGHTFTITTTGGYPSLAVASFSNILASSPSDVETGAITNSGTTLSTGSITPSQNNELIVSGIAAGATGDPDGGVAKTIGAGMAIIDQVLYGGGTHLSGGLAYKVQTAATAINPAWSWAATSDAAVTIASFKAAP